MSARNQKFLWLGLALAVVLGLVWEFYPLPDAQSRVRALPRSGLNFAGQDLTIPPTSARFAGSRDSKISNPPGSQLAGRSAARPRTVI